MPPSYTFSNNYMWNIRNNNYNIKEVKLYALTNRQFLFFSSLFTYIKADTLRGFLDSLFFKSLFSRYSLQTF